MKLSEAVEIISATVLTGSAKLDMEVTAGCGCDLMSDVLAFSTQGSLLLTGLNNLQAIRTAEIAEIKTICFVRGKHPTKTMIEEAEGKNIILLATPLPLFEACGLLFIKGLKGSFESV